MRLILLAFPTAVVAGYALGGRLGYLSEVPLRWRTLGLAGVALLFVPVGGTPGYLALMGSFALLFVVAGANWRLSGFVLILAGMWLNFLVITVNEGMPVTRDALVASGQADTLRDLRAVGGPKLHLAGTGDRLVFLGEVLALPAPVRQAVSVGDLLTCAGIGWFVVSGMRARRFAGAARAAPVQT